MYVYIYILTLLPSRYSHSMCIFTHNIHSYIHILTLLPFRELFTSVNPFVTGRFVFSRNRVLKLWGGKGSDEQMWFRKHKKRLQSYSTVTVIFNGYSHIQRLQSYSTEVNNSQNGSMYVHVCILTLCMCMFAYLRYVCVCVHTYTYLCVHTYTYSWRVLVCRS